VVDVWATFADGTGYKRRPAVVVAHTRNAVTVLLCTTSADALRRRGTVRMERVAEAGLARPTAVLAQRPVEVPRTHVVGIWGNCAETDWRRIRALLPEVS
jgi:PemK-like protein.